MSLQEVKFLLQKHQIVPNRLLGQNFMIDPSIYGRLAKYSALTERDTVLDVGAGFGFLTRFLATICKRVIAVEKDPAVAKILIEQVRGQHNIEVIEGDILKLNVPAFNKAVSIPPYYLSSNLVTWLLTRDFENATLIVQKEFADRLTANVGSEDYGWITVLTNQAVEAEILGVVPGWEFYPQPSVDSVILCLRPWKVPPFIVKDRALFKRLAKWLFTQRNKKLCNALVPFIRAEFKASKEEAERMAMSFSMCDKRARELAPEDFGVISDEIIDKNLL